MHMAFFNHWHNGDCFSGKGWIQEFMQQWSDFGFSYYHPNHPKILQDLCQHYHSKDLPDFCVDHYLQLGNNYTTFYFNTWFGAYGNEVAVVDPKFGGDGQNYKSLHHLYTMNFQVLSNLLGRPVYISDNPLDYVASTNWQMYDIALADEFVRKNKVRKMHLFCNGIVRSLQSKLGSMTELIIPMAQRYPKDIFVCTARFETSMNNIMFTDDIFQLKNDINEIAYLSTLCDTIVGKNSGPFMFCHTKDTVFNQDQTFVSLSKSPSDSYVYQLEGIESRYYHSSSTDVDSLLNLLDLAFNGTTKSNPKKMIIV